MSGSEPLIVTAALDERSFARFEALRQAHFPRERNLVPAHLTLFHALPHDQEDHVRRTLDAASRSRPSLPLAVRGPWSLGRGVAYRLAGGELDQLRHELADAFGEWLTRQDRQPFRPHITVQNKVRPEDARRVLAQLQMTFEPFSVVIEGLLLWRYRGGPWSLVERFDFDRAESCGPA
ncbi:2'-5' RNA ligase family protein [Brevundimonas lutea]|uniref:2'-5' RNA ligase family protein n=1 Tax=Brevundimonas lutea TaxID=2293980 RepID=UPI000F03017E|nr:2'-5' RNA ligase family protein [Brevundimonas lutea]